MKKEAQMLTYIAIGIFAVLFAIAMYFLVRFQIQNHQKSKTRKKTKETVEFPTNGETIVQDETMVVSDSVWESYIKE